MALTLMQRLRLWWKGSQRKREEFAARNTGWGPSPPTPLSAAPGEGRASIDRDGILSAYLDQSGRTLYYLDLDSGEVVESGQALTDARYARIPTQDDAADRQAFIAEHDMNVGGSFREAIAKDRALERAWYNFKTQRANDAIEAWLKRVRDSG